MQDRQVNGIMQKVKKPRNAMNVTDTSGFQVNYRDKAGLCLQLSN